MNLAHYDFENIFSVVPGRINVLVVENEEYFFRYASELSQQIAGGEGNFCLSDGEEILPLSKAGALFHDYLSLQVNEKKFSAKLYRMLQEVAEQRCLLEYQQLCSLFSAFFARLNAESDCPLDYEEDCGIEALLKAFGVCIEQGNSLLERLLLSVRAYHLFARTRCFFFIQLKSVLSPDQIARFYHEAELMETPLFLLENVQKPRLRDEIVTVIDRDLCEFVIR